MRQNETCWPPIYPSEVGAAYIFGTPDLRTQWLVATHMYFIFKHCHQASLLYDLQIRGLKTSALGSLYKLGGLETTWFFGS